ncbi:RDD family protein [Actinomadura barringtoniae]|nr:RDD family protein [Actinomadura barringtoniae]
MGRRFGAWALDAGIIFGVALLLGGMTWGRIHAYLQGLTERGVEAIFDLFVTGGDVQAAGEKLGTHAWDTVVGYVMQAFMLLVLIEYAYQFGAVAWKGRTVGKVVADLKVTRADGQAKIGAGSAARRALVTTATDTGLYALAWILLLQGLFFLSLALWMVAVAAFVANVVPLLVGRQRRSVGDRVAGTAVVRARAYQQAVQMARQGAQIAVDGAQAAAVVSAQAARESAQAARERAARLAEHERIVQAQELGKRAHRQSVDRVRQAMDSERGQQVRDASKRLGGRFKDAYESRRDARRQPAAPEQPPPVPMQPPPALPPPAPHYPGVGVPEGVGTPDPYAPPPMPSPQHVQPPPPAEGDGDDLRRT